MKLVGSRLSSLYRRQAREKRASKAAEHPEIEKCRNNPEYFIDTYCIIEDTQGDEKSVGFQPFKLWKDQKVALESIHDSEKIIILKARQLGISWLVCAYVLWFSLFHLGKLCLLFSKTEEDSYELIRRIAGMYARLPDWFREACPLLKPANMSSIWFQNGSRIKGGAATATAGSGEAASILVLDELAKMQFANQLYTAASATIDNGITKLISLSSAYGTGNLFHSLWKNGIAGLNDFKTLFLPWKSRPGRDQNWYDEKVRNAVDPDMVKQEYPENWMEAFLSSGRVRFQSAWIVSQDKNIARGKELRKNVIEILDRSTFLGEESESKWLTIYQLPRVGQRCGIGCDVAFGQDPEKGDFDCATVVDLDTLEELAILHGRWEIDEYAEKIHKLANDYRAWVVVERNNHGFGVLSKLRSLGTRGVAIGMDGNDGWETNVKTKPLSIDQLAIMLRDEKIKIHTEATLLEMQQYQKTKNGGTSAPPGPKNHDDRVMSWAVLLGWLAHVPQAAEVKMIPNLLNNKRWGA